MVDRGVIARDLSAMAVMLAAAFSAGLLFLYPSVKALADYICSELRVASDTEMAIKAADAAGVPDLEELSADELNAILAEFAEAAP